MHTAREEEQSARGEEALALLSVASARPLPSPPDSLGRARAARSARACLLMRSTSAVDGGCAAHGRRQDPHSPEYVQRLKDEVPLVNLMQAL